MLTAKVIGLDGLEALVNEVREQGFDVLGPTLRDGVITYGPIRSADDFPVGWGDDQAPAHYRSTRRADAARFGYAAPAQSAKPVFFPADEVLWRSRSTTQGPQIEPSEPAGGRTAYIGIRACDLAALAQHDHILTERLATDVHYASRRQDALLVVAACTHPSATCFCASVGTGPAPRGGYDLALTELTHPQHRFVVDIGSSRGQDLLDRIGAGDATADDVAAARGAITAAAEGQQRRLRTDDLVGVLFAAVESPRWDELAARCLSCTNCTLVCPTCFCTTITDVSDLTGVQGERHRQWASCFTKDYSYIHGGSVRTSGRSRYRQWLTHKLASWQVQFDALGCVGCGRCITWCPAGIDLTEEIDALRAAPAATPPAQRPQP